MTERVGRGELTFTDRALETRADRKPNFRGSITVERDLPAGTTLWVPGSTQSIVGISWVLLLIEIANKGARDKRVHRWDNHQLELGRHLHRQVGRLFALEDAADVARCSQLARGDDGRQRWRPVTGEHLSPPDTRLGSGF